MADDEVPARLAMTDPERLELLEAEARYHRQRYDLYRARMYGMRPASEARLRELERASERAQERLRHARQESGREPPTG